MDSYSTHQWILVETLLRTTGPVIEFGCGNGSTVLMHRLCADHNRKLITVESNKEWFEQFTYLANSKHEMILVSNWDEALVDPRIIGKHYGVAFIDQAPFEARLSTINALKEKAEYCLIHDIDYFPEHGLFGVNVRGLVDSSNRGVRTYDDVFKYYKEFFPLEPWPNARCGPPTLLASQFDDVSTWTISQEALRIVAAENQ